MCWSPARRAGRVAEAAAKLDGVKKVLLADGAAYEHMLAEPVAALVVSLAASYDAIVAPATTTGKNIMPRVAALLDVMQISDIVKVIAPDTFERLIYAGNAVQTVRSRDKIKVITVRTSDLPGDRHRRRRSRSRSVPGVADPGISTFVGEELSKSERPELTSAKIIISGGRAMQSRENFTKYIEPVADKLGAAVGASRAAVDAGYAPNDWQVGQTGKVVAPELYIAVGISGAIQHLAGMKDFEGDRGHQQGRRGADLSGRRLWAGRRSLPGAAGARGGARQDRPLTIGKSRPWRRGPDRRRYRRIEHDRGQRAAEGPVRQHGAFISERSA